MKKLMVGSVALVMVLGLVGVLAAGWFPLSMQTQAHMGATHVYEVNGGDFVSTSTNGAVTNQMFVAQANQAVELVAMTLPQAFDTGYTNGITVSCGDTNSATKFLAATQIGPTGTVSVAFGKGTYNSGSSSNVTLATTKTVYTQATKIFVIAQPDSTSAGSDFTKGKARFYFRVWSAAD